MELRTLTLIRIIDNLRLCDIIASCQAERHLVNTKKVPLLKENIQRGKQTKRAFLWCGEKLLCMKLKIVMMASHGQVSKVVWRICMCVCFTFLFSAFCFAPLRRCRPFNLLFFHIVVTFSTIATSRPKSIFIDFSSQKLKDKSPTQYEETHLFLETLFSPLSNVGLQRYFFL